MDRQKLDKELGFLSDACRHTTEKYVLAYQVVTNLLAVAVLAVIGAIALMLLQSGTAAKALGFVVGVIALGATGIILASGAGAIHRRIFFPPASSYESAWQTPLQFLQRNCRALLGAYGAFFGAFIVLILILLIPAGAAGIGALGQVMFALLLMPMVIVVAAGLLSLLVGIFVVPADVALREQDVTKTATDVFDNTFRNLTNCLYCLGIAFVISFLVALPIFALLRASISCVIGLAAFVGGVRFDYSAVRIVAFFSAVLVALAAALPMACFNVIIGLKYREIVRASEEDPANGAER